MLVTGNVGAKDLSRRLDLAFEDDDEVLQFVVDGQGWPDDGEPTAESLMTSLIDDTAERLADPDV